MELTVLPLEKSGWRGPGAPRKEVPEHIVDMLAHVLKTGHVGRIDIQGDSPEDVTEALNALRTGARHLERRINIQHDRRKHEIRFRFREEDK